MYETRRSLAAHLFELIERHPEGLRTDEARARLPGGGGRRPAIDDVAGALLGLQRQGLARIDASRRWHARPVTAPGPVTTAPATTDVTAGTQQRPVGSAGPVLVAVAARSATGEAASAAPPICVPAGERLRPSWAVLRGLLPYYAEALARNERALLLGASERYGEQFLLAAPSGRWWPGEHAACTLAIDRALLPAAFLTALARRTREPVHVAYPLALVQPNDPQRPPFLQPVASLAADWTLDADTLRLTLPGQTPAIEWRWACGQRQRGRRIRELLDALDVHADDEAWQAGAFVDWPTFVERLAGAVPAELRTPLDPARPIRELDCGRPAGLYGALGLFLSSELQYARGAVRDLHALGQWSDAEFAATALAPLFAAAASGPTGALADAVPVLEPLALGEDQLAAVRAGLNAPLTVVTGPPGTGKSQVAVALLASAALSGRSVLFASRNHQAIEAVAGRLAELVEHRPLLLRANARDGGEGFGFERAIDAILARPGAGAQRERLAESVAALARLDATRTHALDAAMAAVLEAEELGRLEAAIADREAALGIADGAPLPPVPIPIPVPVPAHRGWLMRYLAPWLRRLRLRRLRRYPLDWHRFGLDAADEAALELHERRLADLAELARLRQARSRLETSVRERSGRSGHDDPVSLGEQLAASARSRLHTLAGTLAECAPADRQALTALRGDLTLARDDGAPGAARTRALWSAQRALILGQMPLWAVSNLGAARRIPLVPGLFDYVVLDEAAQCDIASALPLLARARRAVVIGDPAQLTAITQVPVAWEVEALRGAGLLVPGIGSYLFSANSLFHFAAAASAQHHLLRDHYRCHEDIADYISATFYGRRLRPLTDPRRLQPPPGQRAGFHWSAAPGPLQPARSGCSAPAEIEAIVAELRRLLVDDGFTGSVGVVTPFREQANRLRDRLERTLPAEVIARTHLEVHTAHGFQGDARDVMLFSLCVGPDLPVGARAFLRETGNLVNVAVSRARAVCHVFGDLDYAARCGIPHLEALLARRRPPAVVPATFESPWEERLFHALAARGIETVPQYPVAGRRLDLALLAGAVKLDIEVDGDRYHRDPDGRRKPADLWRDHQLHALGWRVVRFWVYELRENMDECVERVIAETRSTGS